MLFKVLINYMEFTTAIYLSMFHISSNDIFMENFALVGLDKTI
jgi:hypothetical protein